MKLWMKALVWLGLGGGIGFFAGYQVGYYRNVNDVKESAVELLNEKDREHKQIMDEKQAEYEAALNALRSYKGLDGDPLAENFCRDVVNGVTEAIDRFTEGDAVSVEEEDPGDMVEVPEMPDDPLEEEDEGEGEEEEEIDQPHPEDFLPFSITKSEYIQNKEEYGKLELDFYAEDGVIYDPRAEEKWEHPEQLLGIGWEARFIQTGNVPVNEVYIMNNTMGMIYKITKIDASFSDLYEEE